MKSSPWQQLLSWQRHFFFLIFTLHIPWKGSKTNTQTIAATRTPAARVRTEPWHEKYHFSPIAEFYCTWETSRKEWVLYSFLPPSPPSPLRFSSPPTTPRKTHKFLSPLSLPYANISKHVRKLVSFGMIPRFAMPYQERWTDSRPQFVGMNYYTSEWKKSMDGRMNKKLALTAVHHLKTASPLRKFTLSLPPYDRLISLTPVKHKSMGANYRKHRRQRGQPRNWGVFQLLEFERGNIKGRSGRFYIPSPLSSYTASPQDRSAILPYPNHSVKTSIFHLLAKLSKKSEIQLWIYAYVYVTLQ